MKVRTSNVYRFGRYELDRVRGILSQNGLEIELRPKTFNVLQYLIENSGRLVSKDELMRAVWGDVVVTEDSLVRCIGEIRVALDDTRQRMIRTMPRRGYLFNAPVKRLTESTRQTNLWSRLKGRYIQASTQYFGGRFRRYPLVTSCALIIFVVLGIVFAHPAIWQRFAGRMASVQPSIAVIPFKNLNGDTTQDYFSDGLSDDLVVRLAHFPELIVIASNSSFTYRDRSIRAKRIGRELGVRYLVTGSVKRDKTSLRVSVQLIDTETESQLWARQYDRLPLEVFSLQDALTQEIVATLASKVIVSDLNRKISIQEVDLSAYDLVLRAREVFFRRATKQSTMRARALAKHAVSADPSYAPAYVELGRTFYRAYTLQWDGPEALDQALELALTAVSLNASLASAYELLGRVYLRQGNLTGAIVTLQRALSINPNRAESYASLADALTFAGRTSEAVALLEKSIRLDPHYSARIEMYLGRALYFEKRYAEAETHLSSCAMRAPQFRPCFMYLAPVYAELGRYKQAGETVAKLLNISPGFTVSSSVRKHLPFENDAMQFYTVGLLKAGVPE